VPIAAYASFFEPYNLPTERLDLNIADRVGREPIRIGVLADIQTNHVTDYEHAAVDRVMSLKPDLILLPGDLFQGSDEMARHEMGPMRALLSKLNAPGGVFMILGNVDPLSRTRKFVEGTGVELLVNERRRVRIHDRIVTIGGTGWPYYDRSARGLIARMERKDAEGDIRILMAHSPDAALLMSRGSRIDLLVSGHTHGGQVVIPLWGPPLTLARIPKSIAAGGLHDFSDFQLYVSRGVGLERHQAPRVRFLCPPEVTLLTITDEKANTADRPPTP